MLIKKNLIKLQLYNDGGYLKEPKQTGESDQYEFR